MNKVIVIAPHPDDEVLGCGATIARHADEGDEVVVIIATNASIGAPELFTCETRDRGMKEAQLAHAILGVKKTLFLEFPAPALNAFPEYKISLQFNEIFETIHPTHLYLPHPGDLHQDHKAIYRAGLVSSRPISVHKIANILCYETLSETEWSPMQESKFVPNHFVDVSKYFSKKLEAMRSYKSQLKQFPHSRSVESIEALATYRGATIGVSRAEAFSVERQIL